MAKPTFDNKSSIDFSKSFNEKIFLFQCTYWTDMPLRKVYNLYKTFKRTHEKYFKYWYEEHAETNIKVTIQKNAPYDNKICADKSIFVMVYISMQPLPITLVLAVVMLVAVILRFLLFCQLFSKSKQEKYSLEKHFHT